MTSSACTASSSGSTPPSSRRRALRFPASSASKTRARRSSSASRAPAAPIRTASSTQLAAVAGALAAAPGPKLESLGWRERSLELQLVAPNTDSIARFAQGINQRGLSADVASTTNSEKGVEAQVRIAAGAHK